jgi:transposase InsO family protein
VIYLIVRNDEAGGSIPPPSTKTLFLTLLYEIQLFCPFAPLAPLNQIQARFCLPTATCIHDPAPVSRTSRSRAAARACATFYYLCRILDGCSRFLVHWDLRESMNEADIEIILERAKERYPGVKPRVISDNGPQFIAKDFKEFIRISGMTHSGLRRTTLNRTAKSNVGTNHSKGNASARERRCRRKMRGVWLRVTWSIIITSV